jgi:AcrR family transcriptional regulator
MIIEAAERLLAARDPTELTFEDVAEAAGVSRTLVHTYFGDRAGLLAEVYLRASRSLDDDLTRALQAPGGPLEQLDRVVDAYLRAARDEPALWRLLTTTAASGHPAVRAARQARWAAVARAWGDTPRARLLACGVIGLIESALQAWRERSADTLDAEEVRATLVAMLWRGLDDLGHRGLLPAGA